ncbi:MAG TPA: hypothetical protein VGR72_10180 [Candidatus Acidoferrales bacterium]|nr:hypothetical protein [Candidatus Acidoferrales bacterium]
MPSRSVVVAIALLLAPSFARAQTQTPTPAPGQTSSSTASNSSGTSGASPGVGQYNLGPTRAFFSAGVILSQDNNQFQNSAVFLSLNVDNMWLRSSSWDTDGVGLRPKQANTFFDARLTTAPVASCTQNSTATGCVTSSSGLIDTFNASKKSALISGGLYLPYYGKVYADPDDPNHGYVLFLAPLVKGGFQTLVDSAQSTTGAPGGAQTTVTTLNNQTFFHFFGVGARLGLYRIHKEKGQRIPPDPQIYLDIVGGKYENFPKTNPSTGAILDHPWRLGMEGRFRIPRVPFLMIGFDSNTRTGNSLGSSKGDLRFLFGTSFDIGCVFQKFLNTSVTQVQGCDNGKDEPKTRAAPSSSGGAAH